MSVDKMEIAHGEWVTARWTLNPFWKRGGTCWIGVFLDGANLTALAPHERPAHWGAKPWTASAPVKFASCVELDDDFIWTGRGQKRMRMLAQRKPLRVALFLGGYEAPRLEALSAPITVRAAARFPRLARTAVSTEMRLTWSSGRDAERVHLDDGSAHESKVTVFGQKELCGAPATTHGYADPPHVHTVVFSGLEAGRQYTYSGAVSGSFTLPRADEERFRAAIIADVGAEEPDGMHTPTASTEEPKAGVTYEGAAKLRPDLVFHLGDLCYARGYLPKWDLFFEQISPIARNAPLMTALGNHEVDWPTDSPLGPVQAPGVFRKWDSGGECGVPAMQYLPMPQPEGWYAFDHGPVHFIILNTEQPCRKGSAQYKFLEQALDVDRSKTPWIVLGGHRPMYMLNKIATIGGLDGIQDVEDLIIGHVDLALFAHVHNLQRTCPLHRGKCTADGLVHAIIGNGGHHLKKFPSPRAHWSVFQEKTLGYNALDANRTHLTLTFFNHAHKVLHVHTLTTNRGGKPDAIVAEILA